MLGGSDVTSKSYHRAPYVVISDILLTSVENQKIDLWNCLNQPSLCKYISQQKQDTDPMLA